MSDSRKANAIVLAAGIGSRMGARTKGMPKTLLKIGNDLIIDRILKSLSANGVSSVRVVVGHKAESVIEYISNSYHMPDYDLSYVYNPWYAASNTACSLWLASSILGSSDTLVINGDVIVTDEAVRRLVSDGSSCIGCVRRKCGAEEVKVIASGGSGVSLGKGLDPSRSWGEYIGLARIAPREGKRLKDALEAANRDGHSALFYDDVIDGILGASRLKVIDMTDLPLAEIDTESDLARWVESQGGKR